MNAGDAPGSVSGNDLGRELLSAGSEDIRLVEVCQQQV